MSEPNRATDGATQSSRRPTRRQYLLCLPVVFLVAVATYVRTTDYWFVAADSLTLIETSRVGTVADLADLFTQPLMHGSSFTDVALFYRPISSLSYAVDYALWGLSPGGYHLTNVVLHAIAAVLVALVVADLTARVVVGALSGGLFAVHPLAVAVIPAVARRQDVLLTIFVLVAVGLFVRSRREDRPRLLGGALVAYVLALGAKETALVVPAVVFAWVAIDREGRWRARIREGIRATVPFVVVTAGYVVVRVAVLGGLGGYRSGIGTEPDGSMVFLPLKFLLWLGQPTSLVETLPAGLRVPVLLVAAGGLLVGGLLVRRGRTRGRLDRVASRSWGLSLALFAALVGVFALMPGATGTSGGASAAVRYLVDSLFVGGCLAGLLAAARTIDPPFDAATRRLVGFLAAWVVAVPGLLVVAGAGIGSPLEVGDQIQTGYLCLVPAMAGLSLVTVVAGERVVAAARTGTLRPDANLVVVGLAVALTASLLVASPLVHPYPEWEQRGEQNYRTLAGLDDEPSGVALTAAASAGDPPESEAGPLAASTERLNRYTVEAWVRLRASPRDGRLTTGGEVAPAVPEKTSRSERRVRMANPSEPNGMPTVGP